MTVQELEKIKRNATLQAVRVTNYFPLLILRDHFGFGEVRLKRFQEKYASMWDDFNNGLIDIGDIAAVLDEEVNVTWDDVEDTVK